MRYVTATMQHSLSLLLLSLLTVAIYANDSLLEQADELAMVGKHKQAEQLYTEFLTANPGHLHALLQRGFVRSWQGNYLAAQNDFEAILERHPGNVNALNGLGYALAWNQQYQEAETIFQQALSIVPGRFETIKGMAYTSLWSGSYQKAIARFRVLAGVQPANWQIHQALAQSYAGAGDRTSAEASLETALKLAPANNELRDQLASLSDVPARADMLVWGGYTNLDASNGFDLRAIEIATSPSVNSRLWFRYDNTLSLDNSSLLTLSDERPAYWAGVLKAWSGGWISKLEVGARQVSNSWEETIVSLEQTKVFSNLTALKAGAFFTDIRSGGREYTIFSGISQPLSSIFKLEPIFYYTRNSVSDDTAWRILLGSQLDISPSTEIGAGFAFGRIDSAIPAAAGDITTTHFILNQHLFYGNRLFLLYRHESLVAESFSVFSLGFKMNLGRR